ncbi:zinc metalloprotease HtpX [Candidatus Kaiserbacteria bacterium RIFCSPHIGHO2_01_FULL_49_13]|uniref:Protease HtpX homolog n=1 Tax=Candidatus Kaiserbacteria bacterium RIFCSPHIGHO2_01_FULL_49_13 TaxID=1798477 RepID=A0A1F6CDA7_9BACT|nr:MAG: zinc metalloprotease HtpX [Candidatus Kaiserbacteria bacterium RIFCSPHIGHO2_01_FULL_49_13]
MATLYTHKDSNIRKTWFLMTSFLLVVIGFGWIMAQAYGDPSLLYIAVAFSVGMNIASYWWSDKLVLKMSGAKPMLDGGEFSEIHNIVENLAITAGLPKPRLYIINDPAPNAFATGRDSKHAVVAVTTGLLQMLNRAELEGVIAHELSHVGNRDMLVSTVVVVLVGFVTLLSDFFLRAGHLGGGNNRDNRAQGIFVIVGIVLAILAPIVATLIQLAISRKREFLADASGALLTRYPEGLASALQKIGQYSRPMIRANNATAHLFISNPFGKDGTISKLFMTHPPIEARVKALLGR